MNFLSLEVLLQVGLGLVLLVLIVADCALFTNAIEWLGKRLNLSDGAVGSVLAAVGTALPETLVPLVALAAGVFNPDLGRQMGQDIGVGAILGAPFMLATLAMGLSGLTFLVARARNKRTASTMTIDAPWLRRDLKYFFVAYALLIIGHFIPMLSARYALASMLILLYCAYVVRTLQKAQTDTDLAEEAHDTIGPLWFMPKNKSPQMLAICLQLGISLLILIALAHAFVDVIHTTAHLLDIPALMLSLLIIPIATELPEKFNSVMWIWQGKDQLALGNLSGAMVFQSCLPGVIGLLLTPWHLEALAWGCVVACLASAATIALFARGGRATPYVLLSGVGFYGAYLWFALSGAR
ncbi:MAG: hypothetical protein VKJ06_05905 [Vampirovibrionales bacterium]|nr:hypothetical protein [Vampirovibrionales bacterium]